MEELPSESRTGSVRTRTELTSEPRSDFSPLRVSTPPAPRPAPYIPKSPGATIRNATQASNPKHRLLTPTPNSHTIVWPEWVAGDSIQ